jgi:hypothetical protein
VRRVDADPGQRNAGCAESIADASAAAAKTARSPGARALEAAASDATSDAGAATVVGRRGALLRADDAYAGDGSSECAVRPK